MKKKGTEGRRKAKKASQAQDRMTRAVFLTGRPNREKHDILKKIQDSYMEMVNRYARQLAQDSRCLLYIMCNDKKNGSFRKIEKEYRRDGEYAALSIAAFDEAVEKLHNRETDIRMEVHRMDGTLLSSSILLYHGALTGMGKDAMAEAMRCLAASSKKNADWHREAAAFLDAMGEDAFREAVAEIRFWDSTIRQLHKVPEFRKPHAQVLSTFGHVEESVQADAPYVYVVPDYGHKGRRIEVPLYCSGDGRRRLGQYAHASCTSFSLSAGGVLRVSVAFNKKIRLEADITEAVGVDIGIVDMLHASDGRAIGTFTDILGFYRDEVEPAYGMRSTLANKKKVLKRYLRKHPGIPDGARRRILAKIGRIDAMLAKEGAAKRKARRYHAMLDERVRDAVDSYIAGITKGTLTVMELLDPREFKKGRKGNAMLSNFARGFLTDTLAAELNWRGYHFAQVEPAYTSQACPVCSCLDKANRNGKMFRCTACGHEDDADHVGSINIARRASDPDLLDILQKHTNPGERRAALREHYRERHREYMAALQ